MKPSLVYTILIALVVIAASLLARSNTHVADNPVKPITSPGSEAMVPEEPTPKQDAGADAKPEGADKAADPASNPGGKE